MRCLGNCDYLNWRPLILFIVFYVERVILKKKTRLVKKPVDDDKKKLVAALANISLQFRVGTKCGSDAKLSVDAAFRQLIAAEKHAVWVHKISHKWGGKMNLAECSVAAKKQIKFSFFGH